MEDDEFETKPVRSPAKLSKTPSWIMLGFLLGGAFMWAYLRETPKPVAPPPVTLTEWPKAVRIEPSKLTDIELIFAEWKDHAVWENNLTEFAYWRSETREFSEYYEVRRVGETLYFRSIPKLTRLLLKSASPLPTHAPVQFTESEAHYREWLEQGRKKAAEEPLRAPPIAPPAAPKVDATVPPLPKPATEPLPKT